MTALRKPGVYTFVFLVDKLCRFIVKHQGTFDAVLADTITDPTQLATVRAVYGAIQAACLILNTVYPNIHG